MPTNPAIRKVVDLLGPVGTAYAAGVSVGKVYQMLQAGEVYRTRHAVLMQRAAAEKGLFVTIDELAGFEAPRFGRPPKSRRTRPTARRASSAGTSPCSADEVSDGTVNDSAVSAEVRIETTAGTRRRRAA